MDKNPVISIKKFDDAKKYWLTKLAGELNEIRLVPDFSPTGSYETACYRTGLGPAAEENLDRIGKGSDLTLYVLLLAALKIVLYKYTGQKDIIVSSPTYYDRMQEYNKCVPFRDFIYPGMTCKELILNVKQTVVEGYKNQYYPIKKIIQLLDLQQDFSLFRFFLILEGIQKKEFVHGVIGDFENDMIISIEKKPGTPGLGCEVIYNAKLYSRGSIERMMGCYLRLLERIPAVKDVKIADIELISDEEKNEVLYDFNKETKHFAHLKIPWRQFEEQVEKRENHLAAVYDDNHLTYRALHQKANHLGRELKEKGVTADSIVGIMLERSIDMVVGIFAVLRAGGAYLPIDLEIPRARKKYIFADSNTKILLTQQHLLEKNKHILTIFSTGNIFLLDDKTIYEQKTNRGQIPGNPDNITKPGNLAYIFYTSGTTGNPKGVMIEQGSVSNLVFGLRERIFKPYESKAQVRVCLLSPYVFDASVKNLIGALLSGYCLYIAPEAVRIDGVRLLEFYTKYALDVSDGTPAHIYLLKEAAEMKKIKGHPLELNVKHFVIGGEILTGAMVEDFFSAFKGKERKSIKITNVYGPTECCVDSASFEVTRESIPLFNNIPIGKPMPGYRLYILDKGKKLQSPGIPGELAISGIGVGRGYLNRINPTGEQFTASPLALGERIYLTGDLARWLPDGNIEFIGRIDNQVKIRGFRIELGEIENQLLNHKKIKEAVVIARKQKGLNAYGDKTMELEPYLCAYIIPEEKFEIPGLKDFLSQTLPGYMIPSYFVPLEKIPLTANGKIDRKSLPAPESQPGEDHTPPRNDMEIKLAEIWAAVLNRDIKAFGIHSNFFDVGGNSLKIIQVKNKIEETMNKDIPIENMFGYPTINSLSVFLNREMDAENNLRQNSNEEEGQSEDLEVLKKTMQVIYENTQT